MPRYYQAELEEVRTFLNRKKKSFITLQDNICQELLSLRDNSELLGCITDLKSRKDTSPDSRIKSEKKIALKLHKWRKNPEGEKTPRPSDIHDIIGIIIICPYPSDMHKVEKHISIANFKCFITTNIRYLKPEDNGGYCAYHIELKGRQQFSHLKCELQIMTVMNQGWGIKTHDLIYKPPGDIDNRLKEYMTKLNHTLQLLDEQSEILKALMEEAWNLDKKRRKVAQVQMLLGYRNDKGGELNEIYRFWNEHREELENRDISNETVQEFEDKIRRHEDNHPLSMDFCRLISVYAIGRQFMDRNDFVLDKIDEWIDSLTSSEQKSRDALAFRSCVAMSIGEYEECIENGEAVLNRAKKHGKQQSIIKAKMNLAYFLSEAYYHRAFDEALGQGELDRFETENCKNRAIKLIGINDDGIDYTGLAVELLDTVGAVLITCGDTEDDVRKGLKYCTDALNSAKEEGVYDAVNAFFSLHERRAFRRILSN